MRIAVISDIHSNYDALTNVLLNIDRSDIDIVISLGDNVGYGPEPDQVVSTLIERKIPSVCGNHELAILDPIYLQWFNGNAKKALKKNMALLSEPSMDYIRALPASITTENCHFVHGFPPDSSTTYLFQVPDKTIQAIIKHIPSQFTFVGHTHALEKITYDGKTISRKKLKEGTMPLEKDCKYLINAGSVGQPRDQNNNAKYVILDTDAFTLEAKFIPYDFSSAVKKIKALNLPTIYADRLI